MRILSSSTSADKKRSREDNDSESASSGSSYSSDQDTSTPQHTLLQHMIKKNKSSDGAGSSSRPSDSSRLPFQNEVIETGNRSSEEDLSSLPKDQLIDLFWNSKLKRQKKLLFPPQKEQSKKRDKFQTTFYGYCRGCNEKVNGGLQSMKDHILTCTRLNSFSTNKPCEDVIMRFRVCPKYANDWNKMWLFVEMSFDSKMTELDTLLRKYWCECCGHLSQFRIEGTTYSQPVMNAFPFMLSHFSDKPLDSPMYRIFDRHDVGKIFSYEYDMGTTTTLELELISIVKSNTKLPATRLIARNAPQKYKCINCKSPAVYMEASMVTDSRYPLCEECAKESSDEEDEEDDGERSSDRLKDNIFKITNSPRMCVCGYEGELDDDNYQP
ncbi:hypothetical protein C9374_012223 [Naegleria lovaniensis]|uniref:Uncharacterized protein n=1 Tax=Naegleria lovaniensis TaxID=51637 RepID=A0AA88KHZ7_NAELO|nr:uncharacterized protein C9374_012223 [Naegleria lovaniensis]KAG2373357.1 hypothetical protein C9374_012223 [Naegleria lovaniensis]